MNRGKIIKHELGICLENIDQSKFFKLRETDIKEYNLKHGDIVEYASVPYKKIIILNKLEG
jgi:hypothetical protein